MLALMLLALYGGSLDHQPPLPDEAASVWSFGEPGGVLGLAGCCVTEASQRLDAMVQAGLGIDSPTVVSRLVNLGLLWALGLCAGLWLTHYVRRGVAWMAAIPLVLHPIHVESVTGLAGRSDLLAAVGVMAFLCVQASAMRAGRWSFSAVLLAPLLGAMAMGAQPTGWAVWTAALAQAWSYPGVDRRRPWTWPKALAYSPLAAPADRQPASLSTPAAHNAGPDHPGLHASVLVRLLGLILLLIPASALLISASHWQPPPAADPLGWLPSNDLTGNPLRWSAEVNPLAIWLALEAFYVRQALWPDTSSVLVPSELPTFASPAVWLGALCTLAALLWLIFGLMRRRWTTVPLAWAGAHLLVVSHVLGPGEPFASNRAALPLVVLAVAALAAAMSRLAGASGRGLAIASVPATLAAIALALGSVTANLDWQTPMDRAAADLRTRPWSVAATYRYARAWIAHADRSAASDKRRDALIEADRWLQRVLAKRPDSVQAARARAELDLQLGSSARAAERYQRTLELLTLSPADRLHIHLQLAEIDIAAQRHPPAVEHLRKAWSLYDSLPHSPDASADIQRRLTLATARLLADLQQLERTDLAGPLRARVPATPLPLQP